MKAKKGKAMMNAAQLGEPDAGKPHCRRSVVSAGVLLFVAMCASAGQWQAVDGVWDGYFSDPLHWNGGFAQEGVENTIASSSAENGLTVTVGEATNVTGRITFEGRGNRPAVLDVRGASICFATQTVAEAVWPASAFYGRFDGYTFFSINSNDGRWNKQAQGLLSDVAVKIWSPEEGVAEMRVTGGTAGGVFDFAHPDPRGETKDSGGARPTVNLFNANYYQPGNSSYNHCRFALENTTAYFPSVSLASFPTVAELALNGASVNVLGSFSSSCASNVFALTSGSRLSLTTGGWSTLGSSGATSVFQMEDGCELVTTKIQLSEDRQVVVTGGRLTPAATAFLEFKNNSAMRLKNIAIVGTSETLFDLSGNTRLEGMECALTNSAKFTMKAKDASKIDLTGGSLVTPEISCNIDEGMSVSNAVVGVKKWSGTKMRVELADCAFTSDSALDLTVSDGEMHLFNVTGVTAAAGIVQLVNSNVVTFAADDLSRTLILQSGDHGKIGQNTYGELNVTGGTLEFRPSGGHRLNLATSSTGVGVLNLSGGRLVSKIAQDGSTRTFGLGVTYGTGFINVSGGELDVSGLCFCTENNATAAESVFRQTGGLVKVAACEYEAKCQSKGLCATGNNKTNRRARIVLNGGETEASVIAGGTSGQCRGGTGWTAFEANGGYVRANGDGAHILRDFDEAKLGAKGLTVDANGHDLTIAQSLTSQAGVRGLLVLTGAGVKTVGGTNSVDIAAAGGTTAFASGADCSDVSLVVTNGAAVSFASGGAKNRTFSSLVLGDEDSVAFVNLKAGEPLTVTGDVTIKHLSLVLSGSFTTGESYSLLTCGGTISEDSKAAWLAALANGLNADQGCDFVFEDDGQGNTTLKMSVRERANLTITVDAGATSNVAEAIMYSTSDTLTADVGAAGTLNVTGQAGYGALVKTGTGRAAFGNAADLFAGGVTVQSGLLSFPEASFFADPALGGSALTVGTGTLELGRAGSASVTLVPSLVINTSDAADAAVVKCASDVAVAAPTVTQGCFLKRGTGTLTLEASGTCAFSSNAGKDEKNTAPHVTALSFNSFGIPPTDNYSALTVAEGDLVLKGADGAKYTMSGLGAVYVGMPVQGIEKPARLVVDGAEAEFNGSHFHVGSGVKTANCSRPNPEFVVTNGAVVAVTSLRLGWNNDATARPRVRVDGVDSVLYASEYFFLADNATSGLTEADPQVLVTGGASLLMPSITDGSDYHAIVLQNNGLGVFDGSLLAAKDKKDARVRATGTGGELIFRNGAECRVSIVAVESDTTPLRLTFDDALWSFGDKQSLTLTRPERVTVNARNKGIAFAPEAGTNLTFGLAVSGSGDLVKRGAGTLTLDAAPTLTGVCRVEEGALALGGGVTATGLRLAGAGSVTGGTFENTTLIAPLGDSGAVTGAVPVIAGATFTGRTRIDLARTTPIAGHYPENVLVATYAGAAPDVSQWKIVNAGTPGLAAAFTAADGKIRMDMSERGFVLIVR